MKAISTYPGTLIMPDGTSVAEGDEITLSKEDKANAGVAEWIDAGYFVDPKSVRTLTVAADTSELQAANASLSSENAALQAKLDAMQADLDKLTAPKE